MIPGTEQDDLVIRVEGRVPSGWDDLLAACSVAEFFATRCWTELAAKHYPSGQTVWVRAELDGALVGGVPLVARRRRGVVRLESSFEGTVAGPQIRDDLADEQRRVVLRALGDAVVGQLGGRVGLIAVTMAAGETDAAAFATNASWRRDEVETGVVDCRGGLEQVGRELWGRYRRRERNRGLDRGCTLHVDPDPAALEAWYPLYLIKSREWAQAPVPLEFMRELLVSAPDQVVFGHVRLAGEVIGGHFAVISRGRLVPWQGATKAALASTHYPTTLLYWRDLMTACERGLSAVDVGSSIGSQSLWDFKRRCGARPEPRYQLSCRSRVGRWQQSVGRHLKRWRKATP